MHTSSSNGSTGVRVKVFTNVEVEDGSDISFAPESVLGSTFTISLNASTLTGGGTSLPADEILAHAFAFGANSPVNCSWTGKLEAGNIIRAHQDGTTSGTPALSRFTITRVK